MVESTAVSCIHPDKYNNSVNRIISKEEEREDPRRDTSNLLRIQWCFHILQELQCFHTQSSNSKIFLHTELILPQEILQLQGSSHADHYKASSSNCPRVSKHSTRQNKTPGSLTSIPGPYSISRLPVNSTRQNSTPSSSQHPHSPYSSSQAHSYRILPGEIGFIPKGLSIVCQCNTKVSVFQFTYSCA